MMMDSGSGAPCGTGSRPTDQARIKEGSRVRIKSPDRYVYAVKRLGNRLGTVERIFTPLGACRPIARVAFDFTRGKQPVEFFDPLELVAVCDTDGGPKGRDAQRLDGEAATAGAGTASSTHEATEPNTYRGEE